MDAFGRSKKNVFAYGLDPSTGLEDPSWRERLSQDYRTPVIKITREEAIAHRLRRIYLLLFTIMLGAWTIRVTAFAQTPWPASASIGVIPGLLVTGILVTLYLFAVLVAVRPRTWRAEDELHSGIPVRSQNTSLVWPCGRDERCDRWLD
nr:DUF2270 domain-containing protein [Natrinema zhouii]